ncbi:MAG: hypothetical protein V7735_18535 [Photobacterium frigidiphilum]
MPDELSILKLFVVEATVEAVIIAEPEWRRLGRTESDIYAKQQVGEI